MAEQWNNQHGFNLAVRLGQLAIQAHGVIVAHRARSVQHMARAHTRDLLKLPGGKRKLREMEERIEQVKHIIREGGANDN
jgi:hypothetical protein